MAEGVPEVAGRWGKDVAGGSWAEGRGGTIKGLLRTD